MTYAATASHDVPHSARASVGSGVVALWIMMALNLAWFVPYAIEASIGILSSL